MKYQELAADLACQWKGFQVQVIPIVIGDLGLIVGLREHLRKAKILNEGEIDQLIREAQREALCSAVRIIRRHMATY